MNCGHPRYRERRARVWYLRFVPIIPLECKFHGVLPPPCPMRAPDAHRRQRYRDGENAACLHLAADSSSVGCSSHREVRCWENLAERGAFSATSAKSCAQPDMQETRNGLNAVVVCALQESTRSLRLSHFAARLKATSIYRRVNRVLTTALGGRWLAAADRAVIPPPSDGENRRRRVAAPGLGFCPLNFPNPKFIGSAFTIVR